MKDGTSKSKEGNVCCDFLWYDSLIPSCFSLVVDAKERKREKLRRRLLDGLIGLNHKCIEVEDAII